jgi:hypothetical protein
MRMPSHYVKVKRDKKDICNICKSKALLTWDHVPPQRGIDITPVEQETILERLTASKDDRQYLISQNGVKYRTICKDCNDRLGRQYDPIMNDFARGIGRFLHATLHLPEIIQYETKPNRLIRAICGHLLAAKGELENTKVDEVMRNFIFDEASDFPNGLKILYWVYPYSYIVLIRDIVMPAIRGNFDRYGFFSIIKYFPIGYILCDLDGYEGLNDLSFYFTSNLDELASIPIPLKQIRHPQWPEIVDDGNIVAGGRSVKSSIFAKPR